ncbi:MAG TPA: hypothetical protein ENN23_09185 [Deltaproteobacteria bacterium]|nr:hypothetical protein [Deltaproteobacteria bacterium]
MSENKKDKRFFTIGGVFFLLIVIPLSLMAFLIANGMFKLGVTIKERTVTVLDEKAQEEIKARAINTANEVAGFLTQSKKDLLVATIIPSTKDAYRKFVLENRKTLWIRDGKKIKQVSVPLYKEMVLVDRNGREIIKIADGKIVPADKLVNVSIPANTTYKSENYFARTKALNKGEVYVSPVTGWYVNRKAFEEGARFSGIVRFATPLFDKAGFSGIIMLALDYRHLAQFTNQIIPTQSEKVFEVDASAGNYSYMVDHRGFVIVHPNSYHIAGLNRRGQQIPALTEKNAQAMIDKGIEVLNLRQLAFMDPNLPVITEEAEAGKHGIVRYKFAGHDKLVAYAPINFSAANLRFPPGFGWVGMGVDVNKFKETAAAVSENIDKEAKAWTATIIFILILSMIILFLIMWLLVRGISRSLMAEIPEGSEGPLSFDDDDDED